MRFVIATLPDSKFNLGRELDLVKTCALYGDELILFSPTYVGTEPFLDFSNQPLLHQLLYLALLHRDPGFVVGEELTTEERIERIRSAELRSNSLLNNAKTALSLLVETKTNEQAHNELEKIAREIRPLIQSVERVFSDNSDIVQRAREIAKAQKLGLVKIENIHMLPSLYYSLDKLRVNVGMELSRANSFGALDERFLPEFENLLSGQIQKLGSTRVAVDILSSLPGFSMATIDEILDIRKALTPYTANFRKAILDISSRI